VSQHDGDNEGCPLNDPETFCNPALAGLTCTCGDRVGDGQAIINGHQVLWDSQRVWVNADDGSSVGRFSHYGVDVHRTVTEQLEGKGQCLDCYRDGGMAGWKRFCELMLEHFGVTIPEEAMPTYLKQEAAV